MIKVLMLTVGNNLSSGINRHILNVSSAINKLGDVEVAVCNVVPKGELNEALEANGVKTFALGFPHGHSIGIFKAYSRVIRQFNPDIVHIHGMAITERMVSAVKYRNIKYVVTIHGLVDPAPAEFRLKPFLEHTINRIFSLPIKGICYISNGVKDALGDSAFAGVREVVYNPISFSDDILKFNTLHEMLELHEDVPIIGTACCIAKVKNPKTFTEVMCKVLKVLTSAHAVVIGDGDKALIAECRVIVNNYGVKDRFHWLGYRVDASKLVGELSCFVLTSRSEGLPTSILECMSIKTPFAMLEGEGGLRDLVKMDDEEGRIAVIAPKGDVDGLSDGIIDLLQKPSKALEQAEKAFEVGKRNFDIQNVCMQLTEVYKKVMHL